MMHEAEGINFKVGSIQDEDRRKRKTGAPGLRYNNPGLGDILAFIEGLPVTDSDKAVLVEAARKTPHGAMFNFRKNYMSYLRKEGRR